MIQYLLIKDYDNATGRILKLLKIHKISVTDDFLIIHSEDSKKITNFKLAILEYYENGGYIIGSTDKAITKSTENNNLETTSIIVKVNKDNKIILPAYILEFETEKDAELYASCSDIEE